jgi:hypothetical protein
MQGLPLVKTGWIGALELILRLIEPLVRKQKKRLKIGILPYARTNT